MIEAARMSLPTVPSRAVYGKPGERRKSWRADDSACAGTAARHVV